MESEVLVPVSPVDFNFDSNCSSPYITAPSSPQRFGNLFFSAPTSPTRASAFVHEHNDLARHSSASSVPFHWEEKPGVPRSKSPTNKEDVNNVGNEDFEFNFSGSLDRTSLSAEELFDGGKIRPLKPPPRLQSGDGLNSPVSDVSPPRSRISEGKKIAQKGDFEFDQFTAALEETQQKRGRRRASSASFSSTTSGRKGSRSMSPLRVSDMGCEIFSEDISQAGKSVSSSTSNPKPSTTSSSYASLLSSISFTKGYRKWRLKDFLLFRSASEGRATGKDPLRKYAALSKKAAAEEEVRNSSFRSTESSGSVSRRRGQVSAHELHYTSNRAASEEMKKKTVLPYKQGPLGCLGFNSGIHEITRGIGSLTR